MLPSQRKRSLSKKIWQLFVPSSVAEFIVDHSLWFLWVWAARSTCKWAAGKSYTFVIWKHLEHMVNITPVTVTNFCFLEGPFKAFSSSLYPPVGYLQEPHYFPPLFSPEAWFALFWCFRISVEKNQESKFFFPFMYDDAIFYSFFTFSGGIVYLGFPSFILFKDTGCFKSEFVTLSTRSTSPLYL